MGYVSSISIIRCWRACTYRDCKKLQVCPAASPLNFGQSTEVGLSSRHAYWPTGCRRQPATSIGELLTKISENMWHLSDDDLAAKNLRLRRRSQVRINRASPVASFAPRRGRRWPTPVLAPQGARKAPRTRSRRGGADGLRQRRYRGLPPMIVCRPM
jgi:hypothetical protein